MKTMKKVGGLALAGTIAATTLFSGLSFGNADNVAVAKDNKEQYHFGNSQQPKNVILLIGDGMGSNQVSAAAYYKGKGFKAGELEMDKFKDVGLARTYSHDNVVTDSAAAATAFSASHKTDNNVIGQAPKNEEHEADEAHFDVETVLEKAAAQGKSTGLVSTARITHATPAAFASHIDHRDKEDDIAVQMLLEHDIEVLLGGGKRHFLPKSEGGKRTDSKNLITEAKKKGYHVVGDRDSLDDAKGKKVLGLFNDSHMTYDIDRELTKEPSLKEMTEKAIDLLEKEKKGFFLMVEGGRIDHAGHSNYPAENIHETLAFDDAIKVAKEYAEKHKDTLVIVTADHETGGMSMGVNGTYGFNKDALRSVKRSVDYIAGQLNKERTNIKDVLAKYAGIKDLNGQEEEAIKKAKSPADVIAKIISDRALIGWTTTGHTAVDVPVYAFGPQSDKLTGTIDNTQIADVIAAAYSGKGNQNQNNQNNQNQNNQGNNQNQGKKNR